MKIEKCIWEKVKMEKLSMKSTKISEVERGDMGGHVSETGVHVSRPQEDGRSCI